MALARSSLVRGKVEVKGGEPEARGCKGVGQALVKVSRVYVCARP